MSRSPNKQVAVIFRCGIDAGAQYTQAWGGEVVKEWQAAGLEVHDYAGADASPKNFREAILHHDPFTIGIFDHGSECDVYGQEDGYLAPVLGVHNAELTEGRVVAVLADSSAAILGRNCVDRSGCLAYLGYDATYGFYSLEPYYQGFKESALAPFFALAQGKTIGEAHQQARKLSEAYIGLWQSTPPDQICPFARARLRENTKSHVLLGDSTITIMPPQLEPVADVPGMTYPPLTAFEVFEEFKDRIQFVEVVEEVLVVEDEEGPTIWTVISATPFDDGDERRPIYEAQKELQRLVDRPLVNFRIINLEEISPGNRAKILPNKVAHAWRR